MTSFVALFKSRGTFEIANWKQTDDAQGLEKEHLLVGRVRLRGPVVGDWRGVGGEVHVFTGAGQFVKERSLLLAATDQTFDLLRSESIEDLLDRIEVSPASGDSTVTARIDAPDRRSMLPMKVQRPG